VVDQRDVGENDQRDYDAKNLAEQPYMFLTWEHSILALAVNLPETRTAAFRYGSKAVSGKVLRFSDDHQGLG